MDKKKVYYVIVNKINLTYEYDGDDKLNIEDAEQFDTLEKAKEALSNYDDDFRGAIYKVTASSHYYLEFQAE